MSTLPPSTLKGGDMHAANDTEIKQALLLFIHLRQTQARRLANIQVLVSKVRSTSSSGMTVAHLRIIVFTLFTIVIVAQNVQGLPTKLHANDMLQSNNQPSLDTSSQESRWYLKRASRGESSSDQQASKEESSSSSAALVVVPMLIVGLIVAGACVWYCLPRIFIKYLIKRCLCRKDRKKVTKKVGNQVSSMAAEVTQAGSKTVVGYFQSFQKGPTDSTAEAQVPEAKMTAKA